MGAKADSPPSVAILHSQDLIDEWLDHLHISLDEATQQLMGSWLFGYAEALSRAGVGTVLVFITQRVRNPERTVHAPTGAVIWLVPPPRTYSLLLAAIGSRPLRDRWAPDVVRRQLAPYIATPLRAIARIIRAEGCGAIICQEYECPRFDVLVALGRLIATPVFPCFHAGDFRSRIEHLLHPITVRACAGIIVSADAEARRVQTVYGIPNGRLARIPNPIDLDVWRPDDSDETRASLGIPAGALLAVWHGAFYLPAKGLDVLVDAWQRVTRARPERDVRLLLVGGGADAPEVKRQAAARGMRGVHILDRWVHDRRVLRRFLSAGDLYVFSSRWEGYPNALLEAMACGLPVVATDIAGVPDIVGRDASAGGLLVPPENPDALADAIGRLLDDDGLRRELARRARLRVDERFSPNTVGARLRDFFAAHGMRAASA